ncbi:DNA repair protein RecO [Pseudidiomarina sediminum]|uniref:DNA repair protein RecO n=1 Tax=Pseudidiomarina sediminum TaxID=431675 RepID=A0A432Z861_9GAMM|nr:DNA repair protein RecO [Pseudidiomarina sediminum]
MITVEPAFVLHRWPFQDSSLLVELFTQQQGRYRVVAKGARRPKSPWRAILQPFTALLVTSQGRHELQTLRHAELAQASYPLTGTGLYSGFYVNELVQRLTSQYQPVDGLFDDYQATLERLGHGEAIEPVLREFEWRLLCHLGHGFDWCSDSNDDAIAADGHYQFVAEHGFWRVAEAQRNSYSGATLQRLAAFDLSEPSLLQAMKHIMRHALMPYLGDQPLRSRELFSQLKRNH